jgi:hypothetical protein
MKNKNHTIIFLLGLSSIALALAFMVSLNSHSVLAQVQNSTSPNGNSGSSNNKTISITMTPNTQQQNPYSMSMMSGLQSQNWTGSISIFSPILDMFKSKVHTSLNDAITNAINSVGGAGSNASAVAAFIHPENGFLVYDVFVLDSSNNIHKVIVDPGNGKVLSNQQMSMMEMMSMMHPSIGMMMGGGPAMGTMGPPSMMMDHGMGMMQHGMMVDRGGPAAMRMTGPSHDMMMDRSTMDDRMDMMGTQDGVWH